MPPEEYQPATPPIERRQTFKKTDLPKPARHDTPQSHSPQVKHDNSESLWPNTRPPDKQVTSRTPMISTPNTQAREKRKLAPNFSSKMTNPSPSTETSTPTQSLDKSSIPAKASQSSSTDISPPRQPKNRSSFNNNSSTPEKRPQRNKRKSKPIPKRTPNIPQRYSEVNVLGGDTRNEERSFGGTGSFHRSPFETQSPSVVNNRRGYQRSSQGNRSDSLYQVTHPRRINQDARGRSSTRGQNFPRGQNFTRGGSYGSRTVTMPPRRANNSRLVSGFPREESEVSSAPDLSLQGRAPSFDRQRGSGQRLGSGDPFRPSRGRLYPPKSNNYD